MAFRTNATLLKKENQYCLLNDKKSAQKVWSKEKRNVYKKIFRLLTQTPVVMDLCLSEILFILV